MPSSNGLVARLAKGGIPAASATALMLLVPLLGRGYLDDSRYALWALLATAATIGLLIDFGAPSLAIRLSTISGLTRRALVQILSLSAGTSIVISVAAAIAWPAYNSLSLQSEETNVPWMFVAVGVGSALRSILLVVSSLYMSIGAYTSRGAILIVQALAQTVLTYTMLVLDFGLWSLPLGLGLSTAPVLLLAAVGLSRIPFAEPTSENQANFRKEINVFVSSKGVAAIIGLSLTQLDRWAVGSVGDVKFLADYDLAARFAVMPKTAALTLGLSFVHESSKLKSEAGSLSKFIARLRTVTVALLSAATASVIALIALYSAMFQISLDDQFWLLLAILLIANSAHAMTAPLTLTATGRGAPQVELYYLTPAFIVAAIGTIVSVGKNSEWGVTLSLSAALASFSIGFISQSRRIAQYLDRIGVSSDEVSL